MRIEVYLDLSQYNPKRPLSEFVIGAPRQLANSVEEAKSIVLTKYPKATFGNHWQLIAPAHAEGGAYLFAWDDGGSPDSNAARVALLIQPPAENIT